jgi:hypothetical protein
MGSELPSGLQSSSGVGQTKYSGFYWEAWPAQLVPWQAVSDEIDSSDVRGTQVGLGPLRVQVAHRLGTMVTGVRDLGGLPRGGLLVQQGT